MAHICSFQVYTITVKTLGYTDSRKHNVAVLVPHVQHVLLNIQLAFQQI